MTDENRPVKTLPMLQDAERSGIGRREALQALMTGLGASVATAWAADAHPMQQHLKDGARVATAETKANAARWKPEFLDAHQVQTLRALAERIVPGSSKARVAEFVDQLLAVDASRNQRSFLNAMGAFEGLAIARFSKPWKALTAGEQDQLLTEASTAERAARPSADAAGQPPTLTMRDHFENLKGWVAGAYYSSEIGMRELGWTGNMFFTSFPGCEHPEGHK